MTIAETAESLRAMAASRCVSLSQFPQNISLPNECLTELELTEQEFGRPWMLDGFVYRDELRGVAAQRTRYYCDYARRCYRLAAGGR